MANGFLPGIDQALRAIFRGRRFGSGTGSARAWLGAHKLEFLRDVDILQDLTEEEMTWLKDTTRMVTCEAGRVIYDPSKPVEALFIIKWGHVRVYRLTPSGKKLEIATLDHGTFFGEMPFIATRMHSAFAEAVEDTLICVMSRADVERLIEKKPQVGIRMIGVLSDRLAASERRQEALAFQSVDMRLARALLDLAESDVVRATHQDLADSIGAYRETVTKTLDEFQRHGLVELSRMKITLLDRTRLEALGNDRSYSAS